MLSPFAVHYKVRGIFSGFEWNGKALESKYQWKPYSCHSCSFGQIQRKAEKNPPHNNKDSGIDNKEVFLMFSKTGSSLVGPSFDLRMVIGLRHWTWKLVSLMT
jgi:hypothetical protein